MLATKAAQLKEDAAKTSDDVKQQAQDTKR